MTSILVCVIATLGVAIATVRLGRYAGLSLTFLSTALIAFFVMPPELSFRVENPRDLATLFTHGTTSLVVAHMLRRKRRRQVPAERPIRVPRTLDINALSITAAIAQALEIGEYRRMVEVHGTPDLAPTPSHFDPEIAHVIADVLNLAFDQSPTVRRVSIYAGLQPGSEHLWIAAQHQPDPPLPYSLTVGCHTAERVVHPSWRTRCSVTWFDNGIEHIYQIAIPLRAGLRPGDDRA